MFSKICKGINTKSFIMAFVAVYAFIFVADWVIHGHLLKGIYQETASLWRPEEQMKSMCIWMFIGYFFTAKYFTFIFARGCETSGAAEGFRYGLLVGLLLIGGCFIQYAILPIPQALMWYWIATTLFEAIGSGIIVGAIYKKKR
ncbi:MAG: hypothetical protein ACHQYQ_07405 [Bacteriovoracales bacterium]